MLKKTLIGLVVLSFLAIPAMAAEEQDAAGDVFKLKAHDWNATIVFQPIDLDFKVKVLMDVGLYFEINNKKDLVDTGIKITQKSMHIYEGCSIAMNIQTNFDMVLSATIAATDLGAKLEGTWAVEVRDENCEAKSENVPKTLSPVTQKRKIWVQLTDPKVFELEFGKDKHVANVTLNVKPKDIEYLWVDP
jgi:hypothetical protein